MYSRYSSSNPRYSPPPGYTGSTFSGDGKIKHHLPSDSIIQEKTPVVKNKPEEKEEPKPQKCELAEKQNPGSFRELFESLRGKITSEELIILSVMLLIAQDGVGVEVLILALILLAG